MRTTSGKALTSAGLSFRGQVKARQIVEQGLATREQVDAIMVDGFNWPIGPFGTRGDGASVFE